LERTPNAACFYTLTAANETGEPFGGLRGSCWPLRVFPACESKQILERVGRARLRLKRINSASSENIEGRTASSGSLKGQGASSEACYRMPGVPFVPRKKGGEGAGLFVFVRRDFFQNRRAEILCVTFKGSKL